MPPHDKHHKHHKHDKHRRHPASRALRFVDEARLDALLTPLVGAPADRAFVARCLVEEGPLHHRGSNYVLVALLARALERVAGQDAASETVPVPMRLPPHLEEEVDDGDFPIALPTRALRELAGGDEAALEGMIDCLTDGPPQHALANVVMVTLLERLLGRLGAK